MRRTTPTAEIKVNYNGVVITYRENGNKWRFEVRGREREADSLEEAKLIIDKPEPKEKPPFDRFEAWYSGRYRDAGYRKVTVTSVAIEKWSDEPREVWVVDVGGKTREKVEIRNIYPCNEQNDAVIDALIRLDNRIYELGQEVEKTKSHLKAFKLADQKGGAK